MSQITLNNYLLVAAVVLGVLSIFLTCVYLWEASRGICIVEYSIYKKYINWSFVFSLIGLVELWVTTEGLDNQLMLFYCVLTAGWTLTAVVSLLFSVFIKRKVEDKKIMRTAIFPCLYRTMIMVAVLWFIY